MARAVEVAMAHPRGPVYLVLPREPLSAPFTEPIAPIKPRPRRRAAASRSAHDRDTRRMDRRGRAAADHRRRLAAPTRWRRSARLAERCAIPVVAHTPRTVCLPSSHPMHFGFEPGALLTDADLVIVLEVRRAVDSASAASAGRLPRRTYRRGPVLSCAIRCAASRAISRFRRARRSALEALSARGRTAPADGRRAHRRAARPADRTHAHAARAARQGFRARRRQISPEYLSRAAIGEAVGEDAIIFNEYPLRPDHCAREKPGTFFALGPAGGLGWGFGAALGAKLAAPDEFVVATLGDGAYMFANPMVGHWVSAVHELPILTIMFNNSRYGAVRRATLSMFKDGVAGESDGRILADLDPAPPFEEMARAQGAYAERVEKPADLPDALVRARDAVVNERRQALLNVITPY